MGYRAWAIGSAPELLLQFMGVRRVKREQLAATLSPTCFMAVSVLRPQAAAAAAISNATFSLTAHSKAGPPTAPRRARSSPISEEGVPG